MGTDNNGIRQLLYWLLGLSSSIILAILSFWLSAINQELTRVRADHAAIAAKVSALDAIIAIKFERIRFYEDKRNANQNTPDN
jgi:hypothetical protein